MSPNVLLPRDWSLGMPLFPHLWASFPVTKFHRKYPHFKYLKCTEDLTVMNMIMWVSLEINLRPDICRCLKSVNPTCRADATTGLMLTLKNLFDLSHKQLIKNSIPLISSVYHYNFIRCLHWEKSISNVHILVAKECDLDQPTAALITAYISFSKKYNKLQMKYNVALIHLHPKMLLIYLTNSRLTSCDQLIDLARSKYCLNSHVFCHQLETHELYHALQLS